MLNKSRQAESGAWDTGTHLDFYKYYEQQSLMPATMERFRMACETLLRIHRTALQGAKLDVLDIGCGAGSQSIFWARSGHCYHGIDINAPLIDLARQRAQEQNLDVRYEVGTATALPYGDATMDICLLPELLEHVADWQSCLNEAIRVLRPGGLIYINTSSKLCPMQQEFNLPMYSWYPKFLKRYFEKRAITDRPDLANYAKYPAVNWFSFYDLRNYLELRGFKCFDRFDLIDPSTKGRISILILHIIKKLPPIRLLAHIATPYTLIVAQKMKR